MIHSIILSILFELTLFLNFVSRGSVRIRRGVHLTRVYINWCRLYSYFVFESWNFNYWCLQDTYVIYEACFQKLTICAEWIARNCNYRNNVDMTLWHSDVTYTWRQVFADTNNLWLTVYFRGVKEVLKKRLKNFYRRGELIRAKIRGPGNQTESYDFLAVIDFEATCQENNSADYKHEIIEFPIVLVDTAQRKIVSLSKASKAFWSFLSFVRKTLLDDTPNLVSCNVGITSCNAWTCNACITVSYSCITL